MSGPEPICVVGLSHLGSVVAACWAELGHPVVGLDPSPGLVEALCAGRAPVFEPGLDEITRANVARGRLTFTTDSGEAVRGAPYVFIAFDTPVDAQDRLDLSPIESVLGDLVPELADDATVVVSSQVPVGTCRRWRDQILRAQGRPPVEIVYSPENLRLGDALRCYLHPDRVIVGGDDGPARQRVVELFARLGAPVLTMTLATAEMAKHALNGFLATSVSFINEIATLCERMGADVLPVVDALKTDPRIGPRAFLSPGLGFAGGTLARDVHVLRELGRGNGVGTPLLDAVLDVNARRPRLVLERLTALYGRLEGLIIGILGLTYKAGTSTLRRSVALEVIASLVKAGAKVRAYDPKANLAELDTPCMFEPLANPYDVACGASALVILTDWPEFARLDFERVRAAMAKPVVVDGKNLLAGLALAEKGFTYMGIGR